MKHIQCITAAIGLVACVSCAHDFRYQDSPATVQDNLRARSQAAADAIARYAKMEQTNDYHAMWEMYSAEYRSRYRLGDKTQWVTAMGTRRQLIKSIAITPESRWDTETKKDFIVRVQYDEKDPVQRGGIIYSLFTMTMSRGNWFISDIKPWGD